MTVRVTRFESGLRVVTDSMPGLKTASLGIWVGAGARNESPDSHGVAHLLEHMAFKGTERRNARMIAEEIEAVGGYLNAYTSREHTAYYARTLASDVPLAMDILADILQHSALDERELAREQSVVVQEIGQVNDTPDDVIFDHLQALAYPDQALGRSILGTVDKVRSMQRGHLASFLSGNYRAPQMVVAAAGAVDHAEIEDLAARAFSRLAAEPAKDWETARYVGGEYREERDLEQAHLALAFPTVAIDSPDYYAVQVYAALLGGGMSSRLFQEIREKRSLAYAVSAAATSFRDSGLFSIYAGTAPESVAELLPVIGEEMRKTARMVEKDEVTRAKAQLKVGLLTSLESSSARIEQLGRQMLIFDRPLGTEELIAEVEAVNEAQVCQIADSLLRATPAVAVLGAVDGLEKCTNLAARFA
jgi:predicted Zn-dependent peptidase